MRPCAIEVVSSFPACPKFQLSFSGLEGPSFLMSKMHKQPSSPVLKRYNLSIPPLSQKLRHDYVMTTSPRTLHALNLSWKGLQLRNASLHTGRRNSSQPAASIGSPLRLVYPSLTIDQPSHSSHVMRMRVTGAACALTPGEPSLSTWDSWVQK